MHDNGHRRVRPYYIAEMGSAESWHNHVTDAPKDSNNNARFADGMDERGMRDARGIKYRELNGVLDSKRTN